MLKIMNKNKLIMSQKSMNSKLKYTQQLMGTLIVALSLIGSMATNAYGVIVINFSETAGNVIATTSGSYTVPNVTLTPLTVTSVTFLGDTEQFYHLNNPTLNFAPGGVRIVTTLNTNMSSSTGDTFGYSADSVALDSTVTQGSTITPVTTWTWLSNTISGIGLGSLTTTPTVVYTAVSGGDTIQFALAAVPEPSTYAFILGALTLGVVAVRKQRK